MPKKVSSSRGKGKSSSDVDFSESLGKIDLSLSNGSQQQKRKTVSVIPDEIHDDHTFSVRWPLVIFEKDGVYRSSKFFMCGNSTSWITSLALSEADTDQLYLSCHLINLSEEAVKAAYSITIMNQLNDQHVSWTDPEGVVVFSKHADGNNEWGNTELISLNELEETEGLVLNNKILLRIDIFVHDRADLNAHDSLIEEIEKVNDAAELIKLANEDLNEVVSKLPHSRNIRAQKQQEDKIVRIRGIK